MIDAAITHIQHFFTSKQDFSAFVVDASKEEKERILKSAADQAIVEQLQLIELVDRQND